jgi:hypothetical protein
MPMRLATNFIRDDPHLKSEECQSAGQACSDAGERGSSGSLADKLMVEAKTLADLKIEKAAVEGERCIVEADLGRVKYLATLLGQADEMVLRWFILVVALLLDPAAVLLLLAATRVGPL